MVVVVVGVAVVVVVVGGGGGGGGGGFVVVVVVVGFVVVVVVVVVGFVVFCCCCCAAVSEGWVSTGVRNTEMRGASQESASGCGGARRRSPGTHTFDSCKWVRGRVQRRSGNTHI